MVQKFGLTLALLLTTYVTQSNSLVIEKRALSVPNNLPGTWVSKGCYVDVGRTLTSGGYTDNLAMTDESCIKYCSTHGYTYAGTEYAQECYCGMKLATGAGPAPDAECSSACAGNATQPCGGLQRLSLFWSGTTGPQTNPGPGLWRFAGCYTEGTMGRTLPVGAGVSSEKMTVSLCTSACQAANYKLAGVEYSGECYCGNTISNGGTLAPDGLSGCNMLCNGNSSEYCGGGGRLNVYNFNDAVVLPPWTTITTLIPTSTSIGPETTSSDTRSLPTTTLESTASESISSETTSLSTTSSEIVNTESTSQTLTSSTSESSSTSSLEITSTFSSSSLTSSETTSSSTAAPTLGVKPSVGPYSFQGCYTEGIGVRALSGAAFFDYVGMTLEACANNCATFIYFGVEYGGECYCGNTLGAGSVPAASGDCSFICPGSQFEYCGAGNRLEMYKIGGPPPTSTGISSTETQTSSTSTSTSPIATSFPDNWAPQGCWVDGVNGRILSNQLPDDQAMTLESCVQNCASQGYAIAGMEWSIQCFCDNFVYNGGALAANQADCNMPCGGNPAEICGVGGRMTLYSIGTPQVFLPPAPQTTGLPSGWVYKGCIEDNIAAVEDPEQQLYTFPYKVWDINVNNPTDCISQCNKFGFNAAGLEYSSQCFCGDIENIQVASAPGVSTNPTDPQFYTRSRVPQLLPEGQCDAPCSGDKLHICGSGNRLTYYAFEGETPLYKWDIPTGDAAGNYEFLIGGVIVPLMTSQMVTGKITFVEKFGSGEPNGTGAYELDLSLSNDFSKAWRQMVGMQTDVFCSAGLILPDKVGRQLTIGGWAGESNFGVRLYWPDGSDGINATNQWEEDKKNLMLQVPRWYPSALIMANGSILIIGGEIGSNAAEQPTLEILPAQGVPDPSTISGYSNTTVYLDFLDRTAPFNLYPFITVVPSGIFIAYYNEARILDEVTFQTIKTLPNMPGAVNDPTGGRTYQLEGTMVTLPQHWPYSDKLEVLICGGSTENGGHAIDNCVSTKPEVDNPEWIIERMPSRRVLPCMAGLPDGTYIILNGGQHGVAGFGLGGSPNTNAVIYDPSKPYHQRMSIMGNTTVARLYHSEAIVLLDGRVLVSGSDPTGDYTNPPGNYPEEYRVEVFSPPYLTSNLPRPKFSLTSKDWAYGESIEFTLTAGSTANIKVSLLGAVVSTHGNSMGQRTIFPNVACAGNTCTVLSPPDSHVAPPGWFMMFVLDGPTPSVGVYVRIGGDLAGLGDWPNLPSFQLPGI